MNPTNYSVANTAASGTAMATLMPLISWADNVSRQHG